MRPKPHLGFPVQVDQRLWVKVMTFLNTFFLRKNIHKQLLECMIMFAQSWQKWEAISKEYSHSVSFAAVGFQK